MDWLGFEETGTSILLAVNIIYGYFEMYKKEGKKGPSMVINAD